MAGAVPSAAGVALAIRLVNTIDLLNDPPELLPDVDGLRRLLVREGYDAGAAHATERDLRTVHQLRERVTEAMDSRDEGAAAELLTRAADSIDFRPRVVTGPGGTRELRFGPPPEDGLAAFAATIVMGLMQLLVDGGWGRIGRCAGDPCCCVFVDRTRNGSRRFCCQLCSDRINQANTRKRRRAGPAPELPPGAGPDVSAGT
jgi:predicted RNA-binding Zn ribbon-like protein